MIKVSVIVPVYNVEEYLYKCLDSLVFQQFSDYEIICINDCSTDSSLDILKEYEKKYSNLRVLKNSVNRGLSYSRNYGIREAKGEYLLFVDSDDWLFDNYVLSRLYERANENNLDLLRYRLNVDNICLCFDSFCAGRECFDKLIKNDSYRWESVRNFVKKDLIDKCQIMFDEKIYGCEDILFSTQCIFCAERCEEISDVLYYYNQHDGSITRSKITNKNVAGCLRVIEQLYGLFCKEEEIITKYCILNLIKQVSYMCQDILWRLDENLITDDWDNSILELYNNLFKKGNLIIDHEIFCNWDRIQGASKVYLYGAGKASEELWKKSMDRIRYSGVIVSKNHKGLLSWHNIRVYEISDPIIDKEGLVLVSITGDAQEDVNSILKEYSFPNVLLVGKNKRSV